MAIKVTLDVSIGKRLQSLLDAAGKDAIDSKTAEDVGKAVVAEMKNVIAAGISPIEGKGKFPKYKNPKRYPGKRKAKTPVNLKLSGDFLDALTYEVTDGNSGKAISILYDGDEEIKERGHAQGANDQPKRPTIPAAKGQEFSARIRLIYTRIIRSAILRLLGGS